MKGYQYLKNDFFELCKTRKIRRIPMLLYIYLRGLYCRFQKSDFFWNDKTTREHLGITQTTLASARQYLQERGMLQFTSGTGRTPTLYTLLGTVLLPDLRVSKIETLGRTNCAREGLKKHDPLYTSKERVKKRVGNKEPFKRYNPNTEESIRLKNCLYMSLQTTQSSSRANEMSVAISKHK